MDHKYEEPKKFNSGQVIKLLNPAQSVTTKRVTNFKDVEIYTDVFMGSEMQKVTMMLDTGSPWVYVFSRNCETCPQDVDLYDQSKSTTYLDTGVENKIQYLVGAVEGDMS